MTNRCIQSQALWERKTCVCTWKEQQLLHHCASNPLIWLQIISKRKEAVWMRIWFDRKILYGSKYPLKWDACYRSCHSIIIKTETLWGVWAGCIDLVRFLKYKMYMSMFESSNNRCKCWWIKQPMTPYFS